MAAGVRRTTGGTARVEEVVGFSAGDPGVEQRQSLWEGQAPFGRRFKSQGTAFRETSACGCQSGYERPDDTVVVGFVMRGKYGFASIVPGPAEFGTVILAVRVGHGRAGGVMFVPTMPGVLSDDPRGKCVGNREIGNPGAAKAAIIPEGYVG